MLMEQQLQETAGELQEAERVLGIRKIGHQASLHRRKSLVKTVVADIAEHGPEAPAVMRPGSAPLSKDNQSGSVVMPSGGLISFDSIRRDFGSMMQVGTELHERLQHAILSPRDCVFFCTCIACILQGPQAITHVCIMFT